MRVRLLLVPATAVLAVAAVWAVSSQTGSETGPIYVAEHPVTVPQTPRTVYLATAMPQPSAGERTLSAMVERGEMPSVAAVAEVLTDTDCAADDEMISRCRNELLLDDGSRLVLRHPHNMTKVPCLAPGERVRLVPPAT